ncbi:NADH-quinone oxidoreductase subunit NuoE [Acidaminobacter sp. JC074]|uniref:NADH-quinone oxidoreductase subunit NuoE n=1 Tax=Acidaminobacter sp. JC074 TaxID=2530199 RepID=UPI001F0D3F9A|nr:NADH-quinone oxidoreductase subunit NuoE [Acidaminobacter sp. JC074]MCH4889842.1 NADH-quinone oxidoreductase subunit NuoE [Acidaminobacter sp. JC074]
MTCKCNSTIETVDLSSVNEILDNHLSENSNLITILQDVQESYGYLPRMALSRVSEVTGVKEAKVYGVATFYSQFRMAPVGKYLIMLCQGTACHVNGSGAIELALKEVLGVQEGETTSDGLFTYINVACLGCCSLAPVMMINDQTHAKLTRDKVSSIIKKIRQEEAQ